MKKLILFFALFIALPASATTRYVAQTAGTFSGGTACNGHTAITLATWNSTAESAGDTTYVCGTITGSSGGDGFVFGWSGSSGNPITLIFDTGAVLQAPYWGTGFGAAHGAIVISGQSWITINGGGTGNAGQQTFVANGIIQNTTSGTGGGTCPGGTCVSGHDTVLIVVKNATNILFENMALLYTYLRTSQTDENNTTSGTTVDIEPGTNTNITFTNNRLSDSSGHFFLDLTSGTASNINVSNNEITRASAGFDIGQGSGGTGTIGSGGVNYNNNWIHDFGPTWNDVNCGTYVFHHDGTHIYSYTTALTGYNVYNNLFSGDMGAGTAWIYYEQYGSGTGAIKIFNNVINSYATTNCAGQLSRSIEVEGNAITGKIYDNTIIGVNHSGTIQSGLYNNGSPAANFDLRNNTIGGYLAYFMDGQGNGSGVATTSNNNNYDGTNTGGWNMAAYSGTTLSGWRTACSCDSAGFTGAPNVNGSFQPNTGSPLINTGQNLTSAGITALDTDFYGSARPSSGNWVVGAANAASGGSVSLTPSSENFGSINLGSSSSAITFTLTNNSSTTATSIAPTVTGGNSGDFSVTNSGAGSCAAAGASIAATASCTFTVTFAPGAAGSRSTTLSVSYSGGDGASPQTSALGGTGSATGSVTVSPTSQSCGSVIVGIPTTCATFTLSNTTSLTVTSSLVTFTGTNSSDFSDTGGTCGSTLSASSSCTIIVTFTPGATGSRSATLNIADSASSSPQQATLTGTGIAGTVTLTPSNQNFGSMAVGFWGAPVTFTLTNTTASSVTSIVVTMTGGNTADFVNVGAGTCTSTLAASSSCTILVKFSPTAVGSRSTELNVADSASSSPQQSSLSGTGTPVVVAPSAFPI